MPYAAPSIRSCGCVVASGERCQHMIARDRERKARHDAQRPTARERGYDSKWREVREQFLKANPHCAMCGNPATVVDHIIPHRGGKCLFWHLPNLQPLCMPCHSSRKQSQEKRR
ncbi:HNH endonuclease [Phyllobacterium phragmitis]|uniref:HNH endonuclease n=1 Tax=Phyllobacterium phragmitis TaxID=2670329 RepID=UPI0038B37F97